MSDSAAGGTTSDNVAESWEEAGDEVSARIEQRQKKLLEQKQKELEMTKAREVQQMQAQQSTSGASGEQPASFRILRRPQSYDKLLSSSDGSSNKTDEKTKILSYQEKEAAYMEARERIFGGKYNPEEMPPLADDGTTIMAPWPVQPTPRPIPRPRVPASFRTPRLMPYMQPTLIMPGMPCVLPPGPSYYGPQAQQRLPVLGMLQTDPTNAMPFYDSRVPPPIAPPFRMPNPASGVVCNEAVARNPVPYGRPPAQLLSQDPFATAFNNGSNTK